MTAVQSPEQTDRLDGIEDALRKGFSHLYPTPWPQPGTKALCGHVKRHPPIGSEAAAALPLCIVCDDLHAALLRGAGL